MLRCIKIYFNIFCFFDNKSRQDLKNQLIFNHHKKTLKKVDPPTFMKKIYHINQKKSIRKFTRGPPFMIFNQYTLKIIGGKNGINN